jgi:hypothetical protein
MTRNILREYRAVRPVDITAGKHWYSDAFFTAADLANETGFALGGRTSCWHARQSPPA